MINPRNIPFTKGDEVHQTQMLSRIGKITGRWQEYKHEVQFVLGKEMVPTKELDFKDGHRRATVGKK